MVKQNDRLKIAGILFGWLLVIGCLAALGGCSTPQYVVLPTEVAVLKTAPTPQLSKEAMERMVARERASSVPLPTVTSVATVSAKTTMSSMATYRYGRFIVEVTDAGQTVLGGEFVPEAKLPALATAKHAVFIDYTTKELSYYRKLASGEYEPIIGFAVVTPEATQLPRDIIRGQVARIVERPDWCPKVGGTVRRENPNLPKGCLPYGHPQNAMGDYRFDIDWDVKRWELIKLHGAKGYAPGNFWLEETHGCVRLENRAIKRLVELLGPPGVKEGIEIIVMRGNPA